MRRRTPEPLPPTLSPGDPDYTRERYAPKHIAEYLCLSLAGVYAELAAGRLAHRRNGDRGTIRASQADLDQWRSLRRQEVPLTTREQRRLAPTPPPDAPLAFRPKTRRFAVNA
jgi:hypothetical protein